jgi:hypothetical protein
MTTKSKIISINQPKFFLIRSQLAGVHIGELVEYDATTRHATIAGGHRIWRWSGDSIWTLTELAGATKLNVDARISGRAPGKQIIADVFELLEVVDPAVVEVLRTPRWS